MAGNPRYRGVLVRQVNQDSDAPLTGFRGEKTTHTRFAGARLPDFYQSYLEESIATSATILKTR